MANETVTSSAIAKRRGLFSAGADADPPRPRLEGVSALTWGDAIREREAVYCLTLLFHLSYKVMEVEQRPRLILAC